MKEPNTTLAYALGQIDAAYIADAELPELTAAAACPCRARHRRERDVPRFWESGWFAAAISAVVAIGALTAIVLAGQRDPKPPVGTNVTPPSVTETESFVSKPDEPIPPFTYGLEYRELSPSLVEVVGIGTATDTTVLHIPPRDEYGREILGIAAGAFAGNTSITEVVFSTNSTMGVFSIETSAFENCTSLQRVRLCYKSTKVTFGFDCFKDCINLTDLDCHPENKWVYLSGSTMEGTPWLESQTEEFVIFHGILLRYQGNNKEVVLPDDVIHIGCYAFSRCQNVTSVTASESSLLQSLDSYAFTGATSLKTVDLPSFESMSGKAFEGCPALETVYLPPSVSFLYPAPATEGPTVYLYTGTEKDWKKIDFYNDDCKAGWESCVTFENEWQTE